MGQEVRHLGLTDPTPPSVVTEAGQFRVPKCLTPALDGDLETGGLWFSNARNPAPARMESADFRAADNWRARSAFQPCGTCARSES